MAVGEKPTYNDDISGIDEIHYNPLQQYTNSTYNARLTMMPLSEKKLNRTSRSYDYKKGAIMWETGGTGTVVLEELIMTAFPAGNNKSSNYAMSLAANFQGKIVEPAGGRFIEALSLAAVSRGYKTNAEALYLLEVFFTGYDENDMPVTCKDWEGNDLVFRWYVIMQELSMQFDYKGCVYDFKLAADIGSAAHNDYTTLESGFSMPASPYTIDDFCKKLATALNEREQANVSSKVREFPHTYVITAHKDIANLKLSSLGARIWQSIFNTQVQIQAGTNLHDFIMTTLSQSTELLKKLHLVPSKKNLNDPDTKKNTIDQPAYCINILCGMKTKDEFDSKIADYAREIHFYVMIREDPKAIISPVEYEDAWDPKNRDARVKKWVDYGLLKKVYRWVYTGENTEVINTNIKMDNLWRLVRPLWIDSRTHKPVSALGGNSAAKEKAGKETGTPSSKDPAKSVQAITASTDQQYAEDFPFRPGQPSEGIDPRKGWYPHMPKFYLMNTSVNEAVSESAVFQETAQEYSIFRQIHNAQAQGANDHHQMSLEVVGDPYWLMQIPGTSGSAPWEDDIWEYEEKHPTQDQLKEKRKYTATQVWMPFIYFEARVPSASWTEEDTMEMRRADAITGVFTVKGIVNKFVKGKFTSTLETSRDQLSNPWASASKSPANRNSPSTKTGTAVGTGPSNAGTAPKVK